MPIFEYHCTNCGTDFETLVLSSQEKATPARCSNCSSDAVEKLFSSFAAQTSNETTLGGCANRAGGVCQAGGGSIPCGSLN